MSKRNIFVFMSAVVFWGAASPAFANHKPVNCDVQYCDYSVPWDGSSCETLHQACDEGQICDYVQMGDDCITGGYGNPYHCGPGPSSCGQPQTTKCSDGIDNDCDGKSDYDPNGNGNGDDVCTKYSDDDEGPEPPKCDGQCCAPSPTPDPNTAPTTSNVKVTEPNYCASAPSAFVEWAYSDPESHPQGTYRIQIDDDPAFNSPAIDTGAVSCEACRSYLSPTTLAFNTTYRARVQTTDSQGAPSSWANMSLCSGSGCQPGNTSWLTPQHAYPNNVDFFWTPANPSVNQLVQFTTSAVCYALGGNPTACASWAWTFGDGGTSALQNPMHTYSSEGTFPVTFSVTDAQGYTCPQGTPLTKSISVQKKVPSWKEVAPR